MGKVVMMPSVLLKLWDLKEELFKKDYFGLKESAKAYVDEEIDEV